MASAVQTHRISIQEYLRTPFRPDVDFVDGRIEERNLGEADHGTLQYTIANYFATRSREWNIRMYLDTRFQVSPDRFRIPDVTISTLEQPREQIIQSTPLLCIEVLSPEDTLRKMLLRVQDYFAASVPHVWIFDPASRSVFVCHPNGSSRQQTTGVVTLPQSRIAVDLASIFGALDQ